MLSNFNKLLILVIAILPHIFHLPLLINLYIAVFMIYFYFRDNFDIKIALPFFATIGLFLGLFEYFKYLNMVSLIKFHLYIEMVTSFLIYGITLQMIKTMNHSLIKVSPVFLLILSLFYYNNIYFLFYTIGFLYIYIISVISTNANIDLKKSFKYATSLFITALPLVVILFIVFPRIAYKRGDFGFKDKTIKIMGFGDKFKLNGSGNELLESNRIAMEVNFKDKIPDEKNLYFRGAVFYDYDGDLEWKKLKKEFGFKDIDFKFAKKDDLISYTVTIYPHWRKIIFSLDLPTKPHDKSKITSSFIVQNHKIIKEVKRYDLTSSLTYQTKRLDENIKKSALITPDNLNPKTKALAQKIIKISKNDEEKLNNIKNFMLSQNLIYTLKPSVISSENKIDEILFQNKNGYCMHFSTIFTILARETGLPTRIVTGYKADLKENIKNYFLVREKNAHAWCEVWLKNKGWIRIDPTKFSTLKSSQNQNNQQTQQEKKSYFFNKLSLYTMYIRYNIESWVLYYSHLKQLKLLNQIKKDKKVLLYYIAIFSILIIFVILIFKLLFKVKKEDRITIYYKKFLKKIAKKGFIKPTYQPALSFANEIKEPKITQITNLYIKIIII